MDLQSYTYRSILFLCLAATLLSFGSLKEGVKRSVKISWNENPSGLLSFENAIYPMEFNGLPVLSFQLDEPVTGNIEIVDFGTSKVDSSYLQMFDDVADDGFNIVTVKKMKDRGNEISQITVFPFAYDSTSGSYKKIDYINLMINNKSNSSSITSLRRKSGESYSVLSEGEWHKFPVTMDGVHQINYDYLKNAGLNPQAINPKKIKIFGNGGGMLSQKNSDERPIDLIENAITIIGEEDNRFDPDDYILFYGHRADIIKFLGDGQLEYEKNLYSDTCYYFLTVSETEGLRIGEKENLGADHPLIEVFDDYIIYEQDEFNIINSGRMWYGEKFDFTTTYDFKFDFPGVVSNTNLSITSAIMGQTYEEASIDLFVNGVSLGQQPVYSIVEGSYLAKGSNQIEEFEINTNSIPESEKFTVRMSFNPNGTRLSKANLNFLKVVSKRHLQLYENQLNFRSIESTAHAISTFKIANVGTASRVWDISDPLNPKNQKFSSEGVDIIFGALSADLSEYIVFKDQNYLLPGPATRIKNQNLHGMTSNDLLIVTNPQFKDEAMRLAELRRNHDGLVVEVATTDEIYNEFSSGKQDVTAIRDFIKFVYEQGSEDNKLQNVLLFGKGSFDYKDRTENNTNFVPIYTSRNSLHPINSYSSDDYFGFLDDDEGEWNESYSGDHLMDIGVGRLPVKTVEEARNIVDKLIRYSTNGDTFGPWRNELFFIADDGDGNLHQRDADRLADMVDTSYTQFNINKIYVDAFEQVESSIGEIAPGVNEELNRSVEKGGLIFNFTGHGSATRWTSETILNISSAIEYENINTLPLFVTATCEFGRHDNPKAISGAEYLLLNPKGGAIGLVTTSRPVFSSTNFILNKAFYQNVFAKSDSKYKTLGEVFRLTKNQSLNGSVNRNFSLLGDPSMTLACAKNEIRMIVDEDFLQPGDTLKALGHVKLKGQVLDHNGVVNSSFNGTLNAKIFDKPSEVITFGHEDAPMKFYVRDNLIFHGEVTVASGEFEIQFIVPKNITFDFETSKINMYAVDRSQKIDASGSDLEFVIGGISDNYIADNTPPEIDLYINDTSFVSQGITRPDIIFLARLSDESGINTSKSEIGEELKMQLDDSLLVSLRNYFVSELDTYQNGWVTYPVKNLSTGIHKIWLQVWDVHNNSSDAEIEFVVIEDDGLAIEKLINYPNPFSDYTTFSFEHNRAGDDLEILVEVFSTQGKLVKRLAITKEKSQSRITDIVWDGKEQNGSNLLAGVYIFKLTIRSLIDGSKKHANQKLVIIN